MNPTKLFAFAATALVLGVPVAACNSGLSDAERELLKIEATKEARQLERLKQRVKNAERKNRERGQAVGAPADTSGGGVQSSGGGGFPQYRQDCGSGIYASGSASCGFAQNIAGAYRASPSRTLYGIYSPATGLTYTVYCQAGSFVTCTGGKAAVVYFR